MMTGGRAFHAVLQAPTFTTRGDQSEERVESKMPGYSMNSGVIMETRQA